MPTGGGVKHSSLLRKLVNYRRKKFYNIGPCTIKHFTAEVTLRVESHKGVCPGTALALPTNIRLG